LSVIVKDDRQYGYRTENVIQEVDFVQTEIAGQNSFMATSFCRGVFCFHGFTCLNIVFRRILAFDIKDESRSNIVKQSDFNNLHGKYFAFVRRIHMFYLNFNTFIVKLP
jgi:hypothetical protein